MSDQPMLDAADPSATVEPAPQPEAKKEDRPLADGEVIVTLVTELGEADIRVPPFKSWRSSARSALLTRGDDMSWAALTLSREDAEAWIDLDPTKTEADEFFSAWEKKAGISNRDDRRRRLRAVS